MPVETRVGYAIGYDDRRWYVETRTETEWERLPLGFTIKADAEEAARRIAAGEKPNPEIGDMVLVHCPICGTAVELNIKADDARHYSGKAAICHGVLAEYDAKEGTLRTIAFYEPAE